jgi:hypothetical protein
MKTKFNKGFTLYKINDNPVFVSPHSGPAFHVPTSRDENTDTVASICWLKTKGTLIVSNLSRKMTMGIDFNRDAPSKKFALQMWEKFQRDERIEELEGYRKNYAWAAKDERDHEERLRIYNEFWGAVRNTGNVIVFVHRKFTRMKNFPSILDIITYQGKGVDKSIVKTIVEKINEKYTPFFNSIEGQYKKAILLETERLIQRIKDIFADFSLQSMKVEYKTHIKEDIEVIKKFANKRAVKRLENNFSHKNFILAVRSALKNDIQPRVTLESIFAGNHAMSMMRHLFNKNERIVMEVECNQFLTYWHPNIAADIITDLLNSLKTVAAYKQLGMKQTQIAEFVKSG